MTRSIRRHVLIYAATAATALGIAGCNGEDEATPVPQPSAGQQESSAGDAAPASPQQPPTQFDNAPGDRPTASPAQDAAGPRDERAAPPAGDVPASPAPQGRATPPPPAPRQQPSQPPAGATANTPEAKARALLDQLMAQIAQNQWNEGEKTLQELNRLKSSVPREMRDEIDNARGSFNAAKQISNQDR